MTEPLAPSDPAPPAPKRRGCFGMALKSALGCTAFALGALVAVLLLLPTLCQGLARSLAEKIFDEQFKGSLKVREVDLSWKSPQKVTEAVVLDPEGREVVRATAVLPSILDLLSSKSTLKVRLDVDADLVADDRGTVNLQRAIERREVARGKKSVDVSSRGESGSDPSTLLSTLDAEVVVASRHLSWSDADTRRAGRPFEVRDLAATLRAKPGQPLTLHVLGKVVSETPGALEADLTAHGPIEVGKAWPLGSVDAKVRIEGFSTPMIDGIAGLSGKLTEVLGPRFDFTLLASGVTPQHGEVELGFNSPLTSLAFAGKFEGGLLRSSDGSPVRLSLGVPRGFVTGLIAPSLPPGVSVAWDESSKSWTVSVTNLELPIPDAGGLDAKGLAKTLGHLRCDVVIDLPAHVALESPETKAAKVRAAVDGLHATFGVAPGEPAKISLRAALDTGTPGKIEADATVPDPWGSLAAGGIPKLDATLRVSGVSTAAIDALAGQAGRVAEAIGPSLALSVEAKTAGADQGTLSAVVEAGRLKLNLRGASDPKTLLRCTGEDGLDLTWDPPSGWIEKQVAPMLPEGSHLAIAAGKIELHGREISVPAPADLAKALAFELRGSLPGASFSSAAGGKPLPAAKLDPVSIEARMAPGGSLTAKVGTAIDGAKLSVDLAGSELLGAKPPVLDLTVHADGIATAALDPFAGAPGLVSGALGPTLSLSVTAHAEGKSATARVEATSPAARLQLAGRFDGNRISATGDEGLHLALTLSDAWAAQALGPHVPPGTTVSMSDRPIEVDVRELSLPLPSAPASGIQPMLEGLACKVGVKVGSIRYADAASKSGSGAFSARDLDLAVEVAPKKPLQAKLDAQVDAGPGLGGGKLAANVSLPDPWFFLRTGAPAIPPVDADVSLPALPLAPLDLLCGRPGIVSGLLGPSADVLLNAKIASADSGSFTATVKSPGGTIAASAKLDQGMIASAGGPALQVDLAVAQEWLDRQVGPMLGPGARLALEGGKGTLHLSVEDVRLPVPQTPQTPLKPEALSGATAHVRASLPNVSYSDAKTAAAGGAAAIRDLALQVDLAPGKPPEAKVGAKIDGQPPGEISVLVRALDPVANLAAENGLARYHVAAEVSAKSLPTGLVDALAAQGGMLVDVLGGKLDLALHTDSISQTDGTFTASMTSEKATVRCDRGGIQDKVLYLEKVQGKNEALLASAGLTPLFSEKIVGSLLPTLVHLEKPKGSDPVLLAVENLRVPLDADLSKLDAIVRLNLGEVSYQLLPGLSGMLGKGESTTVKMPEIRVPIQKGVASYDGLPMRIGGKDCLFKGTFSLVDKSFKMQTQLPLGALGKGVDGKLDGLRGVVDANTMVPIELSGTWKSPKIGVGQDFLKKLADDALKKQGGNLLDGLLKKKK